jgi:asparagine synthetase B (glutamine-hydrolysing)
MYLKITAVYVMIIFALGRSLHPKKYISKIPSRSLYSCKLSGDDSSKSLTATESTVLQYLSSKCKLTADSYVLLAVSGGLDSMAMLHILSKVSRLYLPLNLEVISFNHKLRPESDEEVNVRLD